MHEITVKIHSLNQGGYLFLQTVKGDIFLYDSKIKIEQPDLDSMDYLQREGFDITIELIYDRDIYENSNGGGVFTKSLKLKDIKSIKRFNDLRL